MPAAQRITRGGKTYYRVQIRRPTKGIEIDQYFTTKRAADAYVRKVESAIADGKPIAENVQSRETFADAVDTYLKDPAGMTTRKGRTLKPSAEKDRRQRLQWLSRECFGPMRLQNVKWALVDDKLAAKAQALNWSPGTRYRYETTLSRFLDYCKRKGWVAFNVVNDQERLNDTEARHRTYTDSEWQAMLESADARNDMLAMFLRLAWATGCRKSELLKLRWVDVEQIEHEGLGASLTIADTKNREDRTVYISKSTYQLLQAHEQQFRKPTSSLVFPSRTKHGRYNVDVPFREARDKAKLSEPDERYGEVLTMHHIRHTWATRLGENGATLAQLMAAGGWRTAAMAMRYMKRKEIQSAEAAMLLVGT
ncbi:MAG: site-specific integrase [Roseibium album]|uniref:tyrosine-type recombinase/integrase n=1 Tax=Roseibium album TaxID=311410 RepID=UPI0032EFCD63